MALHLLRRLRGGLLDLAAVDIRLVDLYRFAGRDPAGEEERRLPQRRLQEQGAQRGGGVFGITTSNHLRAALAAVWCTQMFATVLQITSVSVPRILKRCSRCVPKKAP